MGWSAKVLPRRVATSLLISRPNMGPTEMGRILSVEKTDPSDFGRPVTIFSISCCGISRAERQRLVIIVARLRPAVEVTDEFLCSLYGFHIKPRQ
jgi:hypothetical protein